jgi:2-iminobutanoate/2-iminopropanoate deaminase
VIRTAAAPAPKGPYEQAVCAGGLVVVTAQTGTDPATGLLRATAAEQALQAARNVAAILAAAGARPADVVRLGLALCDIADLGAVGAALDEVLGGHRCPRATAQVVALPGGALLSIEALAVAGAGTGG